MRSNATVSQKMWSLRSPLNQLTLNVEKRDFCVIISAEQIDVSSFCWLRVSACLSAWSSSPTLGPHPTPINGPREPERQLLRLRCERIARLNALSIRFPHLVRFSINIFVLRWRPQEPERSASEHVFYQEWSTLLPQPPPIILPSGSRTRMQPRFKCRRSSW